MATAGSIAVNLTANTRDFARGMKQAQSDISALRSVVTTASGVLAGFMTFSAIKSGLTAAVGSITETINKLDDMAATAGQLGVSTKFLSELQGAAELSDTSVEDLNQGLKLMEKNLGRAAIEGGGIEDMLKRAGKSADALTAAGPEQAFLELADVVAGIKDPIERAAFVTDIFGKSGQNLIGILARGSAGIQELRGEVSSLGGSFDDADSPMIGEADDAMKRLRISTQGLKNTLAIELAPIVASVANGLANLSKDADFKSLIPSAEAFANAIAYIADIVEVPILAFKGLRAAVTEVIAKILESVDFLFESLNALLPEGSIVEFKGLPDDFVKGFRDAADEFNKSFWDQFVGGSYGDKIKAFFANLGKGTAKDIADIPKNAEVDLEQGKLKLSSKNTSFAKPTEIASKEGFSVIARALSGKSVDANKPMVDQQKIGNQLLGKIDDSIRRILLTPIGPPL